MKYLRFYLSFLISLSLFYPLPGLADEKRYEIPLDGSPSIGPEDAPVVMVEFLDYQ